MTVCGHWFTDPEHQRWKYSQQIFAFLHNIENLEKEKKKKPAIFSGKSKLPSSLTKASWEGKSNVIWICVLLTFH